MGEVKWVDLHLDNGSTVTFKGSHIYSSEVVNDYGVYIYEEMQIEERFVDNLLLEIKGYKKNKKNFKNLRGQKVNKVTTVLENNRIHYSFLESKYAEEVIRGEQQRQKVLN